MTRFHWRAKFLIILVVLSSLLGAGDFCVADPSKPIDEAELSRQAQALSEAQEKSLKAQMELMEKQIEIAKKQLDVFRNANQNKEALAALEAIVELNSAELQLKRAALKARLALQGANLIAADGRYLGRIGPSYDNESIFCTYGAYGASYSDKSIWCTYGKYGASYEELSPFCSYSMKPPRLVVAGKVIAGVTVGGFGYPTAVSPQLLRTLFKTEITGFARE